MKETVLDVTIFNLQNILGSTGILSSRKILYATVTRLYRNKYSNIDLQDSKYTSSNTPNEHFITITGNEFN